MAVFSAFLSNGVRRPISLKIFGIALVLLVMMIGVTLVSTRNMRQLGLQLDYLSRFYIRMDQLMGDVRVRGLGELILIERIIQERPQLGFRVAREEAARHRAEITSCDADSIRAAVDKIRQAPVASKAPDLVTYELLKICANGHIAEAEKLIDQAAASEAVKADPRQLEVLAQLRRELKDVPEARAKLHLTFEGYVDELRSGTRQPGEARLLEAIRRQMDEHRADVTQQIGDVTNLVHAATRESAASAIDTERKVRALGWAITLAACALGVLIAAYITQSLVRPVHQLLTGTKAVQNGNLDVHVALKTADEIAQLADSFNHMVQELKQKQIIKDTFGKYVDPRVVDGLLRQQPFGEAGERRVMTVFFSDLEGFTSLSERMTPTGVVKLLNRYFTLMAKPIRDHRGIIDKYIGDSIMAFWGPPFTSEADHARLGCYAALEQQQNLARFEELLPEILGMRKGLPAIRMRMALASGDVTVGSIGSEDARSYTVIGDTVNLASRLESANKLYRTQIILSEDTRALAGDAIETRELDAIRVVGKADPVRIYELLARAGELARSMAELREPFERSLAAYRKGQWQAARKGFEQCLAIEPQDGPSRLFLERIDQLAAAPARGDWDGVWTLAEK
jgi:adenylate cyclase